MIESTLHRTAAAVVVGILSATAVLTLTDGIAYGKRAVGMERLMPIDAEGEPANAKVEALAVASNQLAPAMKVPSKQAQKELDANANQVVYEYKARRISSRRDFLNGATVLRFASTPDLAELGHEMALAALATADPRGARLAAQTLDRFFQTQQKPQRFGTQVSAKAGGGVRVYPVAGEVTDYHRNAMHLPTLSEANLMASSAGTTPVHRIERVRLVE